MARRPARPTAKISECALARRVQFHETDGAGILHFSWYFRYVEEAEAALWRSAGYRIAAPEDGYVWPRVSVSCDYRRPLRCEDECVITIRIAAVSSRSIRYACDITLDGEAVATLSMVIVCTKRDRRGVLRAAPIPAAVRRRVQVAPDAPGQPRPRA